MTGYGGASILNRAITVKVHSVHKDFEKLKNLTKYLKLFRGVLECSCT